MKMDNDQIHNVHEAGLTIWEFVTRDSEHCDDPLSPIMRVNFTEKISMIFSLEQTKLSVVYGCP